MKRLLCIEVARCLCILPSFSWNPLRLLFPKRLWKCASKISFRKYIWKLVLLAIYLFNYHSSKLTFSMQNTAFFVVLRRLLSSKQAGIHRFLQYIFVLREKYNVSITRIFFFLLSLFVLMWTFCLCDFKEKKQQISLCLSAPVQKCLI